MVATLKLIVDESAVENAAPSGRTPPNMNKSIVMIPPNFLENTIIELQNMEGGLILLKAKLEIISHGKRHKDDVEFPKVAENFKDYPA